jgi:hypothetical protein
LFIYVIKSKLGTKNMGYIEVFSRHVGEEIGNLGNMFQNYWEFNGNNENPTTPTLPKRKRTRPLGCMLAHLIGCK